MDLDEFSPDDQTVVNGKWQSWTDFAMIRGRPLAKLNMSIPDIGGADYVPYLCWGSVAGDNPTKVGGNRLHD